MSIFFKSHDIYQGDYIDIEVKENQLEITYFDGTNQVIIPISNPDDIENLLYASEKLFEKIYAKDMMYE